LETVAPHTRLRPGEESDYDQPRDHPATIPWQARMAELLEVSDDYSGAQPDVKQVWELP
jgi:hypothetical protein